MPIAVFGAGGMGGFFGGVLARGGAEVTLIARGAHLEAIRANGLTVKSQVLGDFIISGRATDDPREFGPVDLILFGELKGGMSPRTERILTTLRRTGLDATLDTDIRRKMWEKFIVICANGGVLALLRQPFGPVFASPEASQLMRGTMEEAYALARAAGIDLPGGTVDRLFEFLRFVENVKNPHISCYSGVDFTLSS